MENGAAFECRNLNARACCWPFSRSPILRRSKLAHKAGSLVQQQLCVLGLENGTHSLETGVHTMNSYQARYKHKDLDKPAADS